MIGHRCYILHTIFQCPSAFNNITAIDVWGSLFRSFILVTGSLDHFFIPAGVRSIGIILTIEWFGWSIIHWITQQEIQIPLKWAETELTLLKCSMIEAVGYRQIRPPPISGQRCETWFFDTSAGIRLKYERSCSVSAIKAKIEHTISSLFLIICKLCTQAMERKHYFRS